MIALLNLKRRLAKSAPAKRPATSARLASLAGDFPWRRVLIALLLVALAAALLYRHIDAAAVHARAAQFDGTVAFALLAILPLLGFPASVLHVAAGVRFGTVLGLVLVAASILFQLLASYGLVHLFHAQFSRWRWVARVRKRIPKGAHPSICVFAVLLPGAPFAAINYTLPVIGVPLRTYLLCCLPLHTLRATVTVAFGDQSDKLTAARLIALGVYAALILGTSWWTFHRMRTQLEGQPAGAGDPRQPA